MDVARTVHGLLAGNWTACQPDFYAGVLAGAAAFLVIERVLAAWVRGRRRSATVAGAVAQLYGERLAAFERHAGALHAAYNDVSIEQEASRQHADARVEESMTLGRNAELLRATVQKLARTVRTLGFLSALHGAYERKLTLVTFCIGLGVSEKTEDALASARYLDALLALHERLRQATDAVFRALVQNLPGSVDGLIRVSIPPQLEEIMNADLPHQLIGVGQDIDTHLARLRNAARDR